MLAGRRAPRVKRGACSPISCTPKTRCVREGVRLEGCNGNCDYLPPGTTVACDEDGQGPKVHGLHGAGD